MTNRDAHPAEPDPAGPDPGPPDPPARRHSPLGVRLAGAAGALLAGGAAATLVATAVISASGADTPTPSTASTSTQMAGPTPRLAPEDREVVAKMLSAGEPKNVEGGQPPAARTLALADADDLEEWSDAAIGVRVLGIDQLQTERGFTYRLATVEVLGSTVGPYASGDRAVVALRNEWPRTLDYQVSDWFADPHIEVGAEYAIFGAVRQRNGVRFVQPLMTQGFFLFDGTAAGRFTAVTLDPEYLARLGLG